VGWKLPALAVVLWVIALTLAGVAVGQVIGGPEGALTGAISDQGLAKRHSLRLGPAAYAWVMVKPRSCVQCGAAFKPRREHARFCSAACRIIWSRRDTGGQLTGDTALSWSISAMNDTIQRLCKATGIALPDALALVSEAVWWVTLVDAAMIRYHEAAYDRALAGISLDERRATEGTFAGLRFVRNWMGYHADPADFIQPGHDPGGGDAPVAAWTWNPLPAAELSAVSPKGRKWETARYRHYDACLARKPLGETLTRAVAFLTGICPAP